MKIQIYEPFRADMQSRFTIDRTASCTSSHMDLPSDGRAVARDRLRRLAHWPEQTYHVKSQIDFPTQKDIFFKARTSPSSGQGDFTGTFHFFKGGRELKGTFTSPRPASTLAVSRTCSGSVLWVPDGSRSPT